MQKKGRKWKERFVNYSFVAPAVVFIALFMLYPVWYTIEMSFKDVVLKNFLDSSQQSFAGLQNYKLIFGDKYFWNSLDHTWIFVLFSLVFQFALGFSFALFFNKKFPGNRWMRAILLIAWMNPAIITGAVFKWLMATDVGIFNFLLVHLGIVAEPVNFLASSQTALGSVIFGNIWVGVPFNMILLLSGLQGIDGDLYESAVIDGASPFARFRYITLPMLLPTIRVLLLLGFIYTFKVFDIIYAMTGGGPANASQILPYYSYEMAFKTFKFSQGAAASCVSFAIVAVLAAFYIYFSKKEEAA